MDSKTFLVFEGARGKTSGGRGGGEGPAGAGEGQILLYMLSLQHDIIINLIHAYLGIVRFLPDAPLNTKHRL